MGQSQKRGDSVPEEYTARYVFAMLRALKREEGLKPERVGNKVRVENVEIPHNTFYNYIGKLESDKIIYKEGGRYYFFWKKEKEKLIKEYQETIKEYQEFKTGEEYRAKLNHSRFLILDVSRDLNRTDVDPEALDFSKALENSFLRQHIETGYPKTQPLLQKREELKKKVDEYWARLKSRVKEEAEKEGWKIIPLSSRQELKEDAKEAYDDKVLYILTMIWGGELPEVRAETRGDWITLGGLEVARGRSLAKEVEALFEKLAGSEELKKLFEEYSKARGELNANETEIEGELKTMAAKVRDGEPLRGNCERCSKVIIERPFS